MDDLLSSIVSEAGLDDFLNSDADNSTNETNTTTQHVPETSATNRVQSYSSQSQPHQVLRTVSASSRLHARSSSEATVPSVACTVVASTSSLHPSKPTTVLFRGGRPTQLKSVKILSSSPQIQQSAGTNRVRLLVPGSRLLNSSKDAPAPIIVHRPTTSMTQAHASASSPALNSNSASPTISKYLTPAHTPTYHSPTAVGANSFSRIVYSMVSPRTLPNQRVGAGRPPFKNEFPILVGSPSSSMPRSPSTPTIRTRGGYLGTRGGVRMLTPLAGRPKPVNGRHVVSTVFNGPGVNAAFSPAARMAAVKAVREQEEAAERQRIMRLASPSTSASSPRLSQFSSSNTTSITASEMKAQADRNKLTAKEQEAMHRAALDANDMDMDQENMAQLDTYAEYVPAKLRSGVAHPDKVVETSSLASVLPPDIKYNVCIPEEIIDSGQLSALQLEAIIYACQQHQLTMPDRCRSGFLIGDGAGVGKGRTLAGLIYENYILGRKKAIWCSVSNDLKYDSERDLKDIGASKIAVYSLSKMKYSKISSKENNSTKKGVLFCTYSSLIGECRTAKSKYRTRLKQIIQWCGDDFDGLLIFDECHRAKNLSNQSGKSSKTGLAVLELQQALPGARVVYASATGASEPRNMAYMTRLGLWGAGKSFPTFQDFLNAVERKGVGAMEIVAMDLKRGAYIARQLSFAGTSFKIMEVPLDPKFVEMYDEAVKLWLEAHKHFINATKMVELNTAERKKVWTQFWAAHQRFFKYLCISAKLPTCVRLTRESIKNKKSVVIGLQSTGEARTKELIEESGPELSDFVSTAKAIFYSMVDKFFPVPDGAHTMFDSSIYGLDSILFGGNNQQTSRKHRREDDGSGPDAKRTKFELSSGDEDSDTESDDSQEKNDETDWLKTLEQEAQSSGSEKAETSEEEEEEEAHDFNPFAEEHDDQDLDPWMIKQKQVADSPVKDEVPKPQETKEKRRKKRKREKSEYKAAYSAKEFLSHSKSTKEELEGILEGGSMADEMNANRAGIIKAELLAAIERLGERLPRNTLDELIDELGGTDYVAEMTGRKGRMVAHDDVGVYYELRHESDGVNVDMLNMREKELFMNGDKRVAIISEAASIGISLQSDKRVKNQDRRVHLTLELPWSADRAIQQFGRTHRSNQVNGPEYIFMISELAGEKRFASTVAKRLESLGALTHGDRRATESRDLSQFNFETKWGRIALDQTLKSIIAINMKTFVPPPANYTAGDFFADMRLYLQGVGLMGRTGAGWEIEKDAVHISKFLNRILGLPVHAQNALFQYFADTLYAIITQAKKENRYDMGIMDVGASGDHVKLLETRVFHGRAFEGSYKTELVKVGVERGISWDEAADIAGAHKEDTDGFYKTKTNTFAPRPTVVLVSHAGKKRQDTGERCVQLYRPNTGLHAKLETLSELQGRISKIEMEEAELLWVQQYEASAQQCQHIYQHGRCRTEQAGFECGIGKRTRCYYVLTGSVLSVWDQLDTVLKTTSRNAIARLQVVRFRTETGHKVIGILVPAPSVANLTETLETYCAGKFQTIKH